MDEASQSTLQLSEAALTEGWRALSCPLGASTSDRAVPSTLIITNDFPPRVGGIESFVSEVCGAAGPRRRGVRLRPSWGRRIGPRAPLSRSSATGRCCCRPDELQPGRGLLRAVGATRVIFGAAAPSVYWHRRCGVPVPADSGSHSWPRDLVGTGARSAPAAAPDWRQL